MSSSLTAGPYESAVSMKLIPSSTTRRSTALATSRSGGSPQIPLPVMRMAPNPMRLTVRSPPTSIVPDSCCRCRLAAHVITGRSSASTASPLIILVVSPMSK